MLPPGHIAAGFLLAEGLLAITEPNITTQQTNTLFLIGAFFGFVPDLDMFYAFSKAGMLTIPGRKINHRAYITHSPLFWLGISLILFIFAQSEFWKLFAILMWLGTWSHFFLDSFKLGVMWLWPFNSKFYAFADAGKKEENTSKGFFNYWKTFLTIHYYKENHVTFFVEVLLLIIGAFVLLQILV